MGSEWTLTCIDDLKADSKGSIAIGPFGSRMKSDCYVDSGIPVIRGTNITGGPNFEGVFVYITEEKADSLGSSNVYQGDLVFPHRGSIGEVGILLHKKRFVMSSSLMKLTCDRQKAFPKYLYYYFKSHIGKHELLKNASQVGTPGIGQPLTSLKGIELFLPPLPEQKAIAHILGSLDDKIELNRRMNATLEGMAQALFKSWFVDFDPVIDNALAAGNPIPDELAERADMRSQTLADGTANREAAQHFPAAFQLSEELGWIPEGWRVKEFAEISDIIDCSHSKKPDSVEASKNILLQVYNVASGGKMDFSKPYFISDEDYRAWTKRMEIREGDLVVTKTGRVGAVGQMPKGRQGAMGRNMVGIRAKPGVTSPEFLKDCLLSERMRSEMTKHTNDGTILRSLHVKAIQALREILPPFELVCNYSNTIGPLHNKIEQNISESETLAALRDTLLPKLISGDLRIPEAEKLAEKAVE